MGHAANGLVSSVVGESVRLAPTRVDVPARWFASRVDPHTVTAGRPVSLWQRHTTSVSHNVQHSNEPGRLLDLQ
jgi:hypothetical protein